MICGVHEAVLPASNGMYFYLCVLHQEFTRHRDRNPVLPTELSDSHQFSIASETSRTGGPMSTCRSSFCELCTLFIATLSRAQQRTQQIRDVLQTCGSFANLSWCHIRLQRSFPFDFASLYPDTFLTRVNPTIEPRRVSRGHVFGERPDIRL